MRQRRVAGPAAALLLSLAAACGGGEDRPAAEGESPSPEERLERWASQRPDEPVPLSIGFPGLTPDSVVRDVLDRWGLTPYGVLVYLRRTGVAGHTERDRSAASPDVLEEARADAMEEVRRLACRTPGRVRAMLEDSLEDEPDTLLRSVLSQYRFAEEEGATIADEAIIYGVYAVGPADTVRTLLEASPGRLASIEPGAVISRPDTGDTVAVPQPENPAYRQPRDHPSVEDLERDSLLAALRALESAEACDPVDEPARPRRGPGR